MSAPLVGSVRSSLLIVLCLVVTARIAAAQTFSISVPDRPLPVGKVLITLEMSGDPTGATLTIGASTLSQMAGTQIVNGEFVEFNRIGMTNNLKILWTLKNNIGATFCLKNGGAAPFPQNRSLTLNPPGLVTITGSRLSSYSALSTYECSCAARRIQTTPVTWAVQPPGTTKRNALDVILVLDRSGSMSDPADGAPPNSDAKLTILKWAVGQFVDTWSLEAGAPSDDRLGVVWFEDTATIGSNFVTRGSGWAPVKAGVNAQTTANSTALGDGVSAAFKMWQDDQQNDLTVVVMTNGMQNSGNEIQPGNQVGLSSPDMAFWDLKANSNAGAWVLLRSKCVACQTIGVGAPASYQADLLDKIALQTGGSAGFNIGNTLDMTFGTTLTNILKGNTMSVLGQFEDTLPLATNAAPPRDIELDGTMKQGIFVLAWREREVRLDLQIQRPDGTAATPTRIDDPFYTIQAVNLPAGGPPGTWKATVVRMPTSRVAVPYHISFYAIEGRVSYRLLFSKVTHRAGDPIDFQIEVSQDGAPLTTLGSAITTRTFAPAEALGDDLFTQTVPDAVLTTGVPGLTTENPSAKNNAYQRKLHYLIGTPGFLGKIVPQEVTPPLVLRDDGSGADTAAGDGIYATRFTNTAIPGQYRFEVNIDYNSGATGKIRRTEQLTTDLSILASPSSTAMTPGGAGATRTLLVVPADKNGHHLGPGFEALLHVAVTGGGSVASIADPQANGRYLVTLNGVPANSDPGVAVAVDGEQVYQGPLSGAGRRGGGFPLWLLLLLLILFLVLLAFYLWKRAHP